MTVEYRFFDAPDVLKSFDSKNAWENTPQIFKAGRSYEDAIINDLRFFRDKAFKGLVLQYKVIDDDSKDFMKPWTADELGEVLEQGAGEADICRVSIYNDSEQRLVCTVKAYDLGDEELQILTNVVKSDKDENGVWQQTYDKDYYCENELYKSIKIEDFVLLGYKDYSVLINDAVNFIESGKEQLYSIPRTAGNYKCFNDKKYVEYLYKEN